MLKNNPKGVHPFSDDNRIIFATGPFCGTRIWGGSRYGVFTKSPLTGFYAESYSGGKTPEAIDSTGFDAIIITGKAERPTVLSIYPDACLFHDADDVWGMDSYRTEDAVKERFSLNNSEYKKHGAVVIGPAAENLVKFGLIENDYWRSAGRTGTGAVMGSKNLKAVVFQGNCRRTLNDPAGVAEFSNAFMKENKEHPGVLAYKKRGTTQMVAVMNKAEAFPAKYWSQGSCDHWEKISGDALHERHDVTPNACAKCFMACGRKTTLTHGKHAGLVVEGPEYETLYAFGGLCMIDDIDEILYLNDLCDKLGMDTITAGNLCAFTMEAASRGRSDFPIEYGDAEKTAELLKMIAFRQGAGDVLAEGIVHASRAWGLEDLAVHVKGMEPAGYDPRTLKGMGLSYAASARGACHLRTTFYKAELSGMIPRDQIDGKSELLLDFEDRLTIFDALILCRFYRDLYTWEMLEEIIPLVTGIKETKETLRKKATRITDLTRKFNIREGLKPEHDRLPDRIHREPLPTGQTLPKEEFEKLLKDYYRLKGWDEKGVPMDS